VPTLRVHLAAIATAHRLAGVPIDLKHPRIALVLDGLARSQAGRQIRQASPVLLDTLKNLLAVQPPGPLGVRNRAMLLIGYGAALRRSELVALTVADVVRVPGRGIEVAVRRSKTDPHGRGEAVAIWAADAPELCALRALDAWIAARAARFPDDPLFCGVLKNGRVTGKALSDKAVERLMKDSAARAGLPEPERFSGHSLRAGLATSATPPPRSLPAPARPLPDQPDQSRGTVKVLSAFGASCAVGRLMPTLGCIKRRRSGPAARRHAGRG
jgi:integrase